MQIGFHASHEQMPPSALLAAVQAAERAGFEAAMCSDHFSPWSAQQGESGYAWAWLGAALQATSCPFGVVTAPGQRYHPAIVAQSIATLAEMFPGRFWAALGSGEASNEHITGDRWPAKHERDARLLECVGVIRALLDGDEVSHRGHVVVDRARLWSLPSEPPMLFGAAVSAATARVVGSWADGLITIDQSAEVLRSVIDAFRSNGGADKPVAVQVHLSWAPTEEEAEAIALDQWGVNVFPSDLAWNLELASQFDALRPFTSIDDVRRAVHVSSRPEVHAAHLADLRDLGVDRVYLHHVGQTQREFVETFGEHVLPELRS
ncbi:MAG: TIGR03885 family FMN-dependent LLM class oxidoreductase [Acidimicrobiales bacterium]